VIQQTVAIVACLSMGNSLAAVSRDGEVDGPADVAGGYPTSELPDGENDLRGISNLADQLNLQVMSATRMATAPVHQTAPALSRCANH
jgi:hypothetical protein